MNFERPEYYEDNLSKHPAIDLLGLLSLGISIFQLSSAMSCVTIIIMLF